MKLKSSKTGKNLSIVMVIADIIAFIHVQLHQRKITMKRFLEFREGYHTGYLTANLNVFILNVVIVYYSAADFNVTLDMTKEITSTSTTTTST